VDSERSVGSDEDAKMDMMIDMEFSPTACQMRHLQGWEIKYGFACEVALVLLATCSNTL
jgi:hypothetical protein